MACRTSEQRGVDVESEQVVITRRIRNCESGPLLDELAGEGRSHSDIRDCMSMAGDREGILVVFHRERVHRVPPVPMEIPLFWGGNDEGVETIR
jgi:hypothetical protein